jgi:hypothetical protein
MSKPGSREKKLLLSITIVLGLTLVTWAQGWWTVYRERRAHGPVCFPVAPVTRGRQRIRPGCFSTISSIARPPRSP